MSVQLKVGNSYRSRQGDIWKINSESNNRFYGTCGSRDTDFSCEGYYYTRGDFDDDLVELVELVAEAPSHMDVIVAIIQKKDVEYKHMHSDGWVWWDAKSIRNPIDDSAWEWRIKPEPVKRKIMIGDVEVIAPELEPLVYGTQYFRMGVSTGVSSEVDEFTWRNDKSDQAWLKLGIVFLTEADAQAAKVAIIKLLTQK
jgi:hypothetical protein